MVDNELKELRRFNAKIKPQYDTWSVDAEDVHGISRDEASEFDDSKIVIERFIDFIKDDAPLSFVCHALPFKHETDLFDRKFIHAWFHNNEKVPELNKLLPEGLVRSTMVKSKNEAQEKWGIENQKLSTWMKKLNIDQDRHHNSEHDAEVCLMIFKFQQGSQEWLTGEEKGTSLKETLRLL